MIISKKEFVDIINSLKEVDQFVEETNERAKKLKDAVMSDFFNAMSLSISHENTVVQLLESMFETDMISYWLYELEYGKKYKRGCVQDANGKVINISTAEKLYDYLIKELEE